MTENIARFLNGRWFLKAP